MSRNYVRKTEKIDPERGDALTLNKDDIEGLFTPTYPVELRHAILDALLGWFVGSDVPTLTDPSANMVLQILINRQRKKVKSYLEICNSRSIKKGKDGATYVGTSRDKAPHVPNINRNKEELDMTKGISNSSVGGGASRANAAPPTPISVKEAQKFLAMNAPQISSLPGMRTANGQATVLCMTLIGGEIDKAVEAAGNRILDRETEDDYEDTYDTFDAPIISMAERMDAIGKESEFRRILAKAMVDSEDDEVDNPAAFVMARCKRGEAAILALNKG